MPRQFIFQSWPQHSSQLSFNVYTTRTRTSSREKNVSYKNNIGLRTFFSAISKNENENDVFMFKIIFIVSHITFKRQKRTRHIEITDELEEEDIKVYHRQINMTLESSSDAECYTMRAYCHNCIIRERKKLEEYLKPAK